MKRVIVLLTAMGVAASAPAFAQTSADGSVRGYVKDEQGAVIPGVTLTAISPAVPVPRTAVTGRDGYYRLLDLPPADYTVTAELQGFSQVKRTEVVIRAGLNLSLDFIMKVGALTETVEVTRDTPMLEAQSAVQAVNISGDAERELPLNNRKHWSDFLAVTPAMTGNQLTGRTADSYQLRGGSFASHAIQIDGADMSSAQQNATIYINLAQEAIADVQVKTGTVDASSPLGVGAVMNIATKSGTNDFHGAASTAWQKREWATNNNPGGTLASIDAVLPEAALGGPIRTDRAWFFGAYRYEHILGGIARTPAELTTVQALRPGFQPFDAVVKGHYAFVKGTAKWSDRQRAELSYSYDPQTAGQAFPTDAGLFVTQRTGGNRSVAFRLSSLWGSTMTTRLGVSYNDKAFSLNVGKDLPSRPVYGSVIPSAGILLGTGRIATLDNGNGGSSFEQPYYKSTISGDLTYFRTGWGGSHEIQGGFYLQPKNHAESNQINANNGFTQEELVLRTAGNPSGGITPFHRTIYDATTTANSISDTRDAAFYIQDAWRPTERLTISAGIRADAIRRVDRLFDVVVQDHTDVGPRVGVNYAVTADGRNLVRASWVRVHDVLTINPASAGSSTAARRDLYDTNLDGIFETVLVTPASTTVARDRIIDLNRGQPYINEWAGGFRRQFPGRLMADIAVVHREYRGRTALVERNGIYQNGAFKGFADERFNEIYELTTNVWNWQMYNGLELQVVKDMPKLRVLGSYTRAWRHIAGTWQPNDPAAFIQPDAFANDKSIGEVRASTGSPASGTGSNSLSGMSMTDNPTGWLDQVARVAMTYNAPAHIIVANTYIVQSGGYSGPVVTRIAAPDPRFGPATLTLSNGRVVSNPLATTVRFAYPERGQGQLQLPTLHIWNLRIGRNFSLPQQAHVELAFDVFNVVNGGADQTFQFGANQQFSPNYGLTTLKQQPRSYRLSARLAF